MVKMETRRLDKDVKTHKVMLNDRIQLPDGKVFIIDDMQLNIQINDAPELPEATFQAHGTFIGTFNI